MLALIDGDIIKYSVGFACQKSVFSDDEGNQILIEQVKKTDKHPQCMRVTNLTTKAKELHTDCRTKKAVLEELGGEWTEQIVPEPTENVCFTVKQMIKSILKRTGATSYQVYLSKGDCFRVGVYPEYKANRKDTPKPLHIQTIEDYLMEHHPTAIWTDIEADDAMGIAQYQALKHGHGDTVICSLDKDLRMIPGWHYNWDKQIMDFITEEEGMFNFWCQMLTGDATDNIPGLKGVGKATAVNILEASELPYKETILAEYAKHGWGEAEFKRNAMLLWMLRKPLVETYGKTYEEFFDAPAEAQRGSGVPQEAVD